MVPHLGVVKKTPQTFFSHPPGRVFRSRVGYNGRMSLHYDLHTHSLASDGSLSPTSLVERAAAAGVEVLALTDHDTLDGLEEGRQAAQSVGMAFVPGVEISVTWDKRTIHILGLQVDPHCPELISGLLSMREFRNWRAQEIGRRLAKAGIAGAYEAASQRARGAIISRTHFAQFLVDAGHAPSVRDVFRRYLVNNKPGYVAGQWASLEQALGWIHAAGGFAVIAHPARYGLTATRLRKLISEFQALGGEAMEVVSGSHSRDEALTMAGHCRRAGLLASRGSDYHGPEKPWVELGRLAELPQGCTALWDCERWSRAA